VDEKPFKHLKEGWHAVFTPNGVKKTALFLERGRVKKDPKSGERGGVKSPLFF